MMKVRMYDYDYDGSFLGLRLSLVGSFHVCTCR